MTKNVAESGAPCIGLIMGSDSDWKTMRFTAETLDSLGIHYDKKVVSAHRTPDDLFRYAHDAEAANLTLIIAGAGGAAHLPGMTASKTMVPVIGVPVDVTPFRGVDAFLSMMQMPAGVGVATVNVGSIGAIHAALLAASILARADHRIYAKLRNLREDMLADSNAAHVTGSRSAAPKVAIFAESESDIEILQHAESTFSKLHILHHLQVIGKAASSAELMRWVRAAEEDGSTAFIASATQGFELPSKLARMTLLPVLGVPIAFGSIECIDPFLQPFLKMPSGVATFALGKAGAMNAALFAATILSEPKSDTRALLHTMREDQKNRVQAMKLL